LVGSVTYQPADIGQISNCILTAVLPNNLVHRTKLRCYAVVQRLKLFLELRGHCVACMFSTVFQ